MSKTNIFIKSYVNDFCWLPYCLRSIERFVRDIDEIVLVIPDADKDELGHLAMSVNRVIRVDESQITDGYLYQQLVKLQAHRLCKSGDYFLYFDSDCVACRPLTPDMLMLDGVPRWLYTPYANLKNPDGTDATPWQKITEQALGHPVEYEFMRAHPHMISREALEGAEQYMEKQHKMPLARYIMSRPYRAFSEFNLCGSWAFYHRPNLFSWWSTVERGVPNPFVRQFWSYNGITPQIKSEIEHILSARS